LEEKTGRLLYDKVLFYVNPPTEAQMEAFRNRSSRPPKYSVVIFIIDSLSQMSFHRLLPQTLEVAERLGGVLLLGHHKIGENSMPNVMGLLGRDCMVTQGFQEHGWRATLLEDWNFWGGPIAASCATYRHNYAQALAALERFPNHTAPTMVARDHVIAYSTVPTFLHLHLSEYTHDSLTSGGNYDHQLVDLLTSVSAAGALNTTFFLLMGDHGFRMGESKFQSTEQGIIENNMPGLVVIPPTTFVTNHADMMVNLKANTKVLTSHYDLHHTLRHILAISLGEEVEEVWGKEVGAPGASLFAPLEERTCGEAGVPLDYCSCPQGFYTPPLNMMVRHGSMLGRAVDVFFRLWPLQADWRRPLSFPTGEF